MRRYIFSGFADEYSPNLEEQIAGLGALGMTHMELRFADQINVSNFTIAKTVEVRKKLAAAGISVTAIGSPLGKSLLSDDFDEQLEKARRTFWTAGQLNAPYIRIFSFYPSAGKKIADQRDEVLDRLAQFVDLADTYGVKLCHENEAKIYGESPESCLELLRQFDGRLGCVFDMGNFALDGYDPLHAYALLREYITYFHIKDGKPIAKVTPPGEGDAKIAEILRDYQTRGSGETVISLEPHLAAFVGLSSLAGTDLTQQVTYASPAAAFSDAAQRLRQIVDAL